MNFETSKIIADYAYTIINLHNKLVGALIPRLPPEEFADIRHKLFGILTELNSVVYPVWKEHPSLEPEELIRDRALNDYSKVGLPSHNSKH